jgi:hypothetical protein
MNRGKLGIVVEAFGEAQIGEFRVPRGMQQNIIRFDIAVNVLPLVEEGEGPRHVDADFHHHANAQPPDVGEGFMGGGSIDEFENQIVFTHFGIKTRGITLDNVRMFQHTAEAGFTVEAAHELRLPREVIGQNFHGHRALGGYIVTLVNSAHAALADFAQ